MVVLPVLAFFLGKFTTPPAPERVVERVRIQEVEKQVVVIQEKVKIEIVRVVDTQVVERWHREKTETKTPDGAVTIKEIEDKNIDTMVHDRETINEIKVVEVEKQVVVFQDRTTEKVIDNQKRFRVSLLAGINPSILPIPRIDSYLLGGEVSVRTIGPVWVGAWGLGNTNGSAQFGVSAGVEF